jgi:hypothetical protein
VNGFPAIKQKIGDKNFRLTVNVTPLLLVVIEIQGQEENTLESWANFIDLGKFVQAMLSLPVNPIPTGHLDMKSIDELDPKSNRTVIVNY